MRPAAESRRSRHGHPRLHALPADPSGLSARLRPRRHTRVLGRGDGARSRRDARSQGDRERGGARGLVPFSHHGRPGSFPHAGPAVPAAADRRGRARRAREAEAGRVSRADGRRPDELRSLRLEANWLEQPHGSVLYSQGKTKVLCTASIEEGVPRWLMGKGRGWMTAEYSLLPASTGERTLVEVQASAEQEPFSRERLDELLELAVVGIERIAAAQEEAAGARV